VTAKEEIHNHKAASQKFRFKAPKAKTGAIRLGGALVYELPATQEFARGAVADNQAEEKNKYLIGCPDLGAEEEKDTIGLGWRN